MTNKEALEIKEIVSHCNSIKSQCSICNHPYYCFTEEDRRKAEKILKEKLELSYKPSGKRSDYY